MNPASMPPLSDEQVRAAAVEVLQRAPYARWRELEAKAAWLEPLLDWLRGLDGWLFELSLTNPLLYWLLVGGCLVTATLLLAHVVWSVRVALSMPAAAGSSSASRATPPPRATSGSTIPPAAPSSRAIW